MKKFFMFLLICGTLQPSAQRELDPNRTLIELVGGWNNPDKYLEDIQELFMTYQFNQHTLNNALIYAAQHGANRTVKLLLNQGAQLQHRTEHGYNALLAAIQEKNPETALLIAACSPDFFTALGAVDKKQNNIFHLISNADRRPKALRILLPFHHKTYNKTIEKLVKDFPDLKGKFPTAQDMIDNLKPLLRNTNAHGSLPLHFAASRGSVRNAQLLSSLNPDYLYVKNNQGKTPIAFSLERVAERKAIAAKKNNQAQSQVFNEEGECEIQDQVEDILSPELANKYDAEIIEFLEKLANARRDSLAMTKDE
jgi:hypothetical protein